MLSKFKVKAVDGGSFVTHFRHNGTQSCAPAQIQPSLTEVYEAEIRRLREENHSLRIQHNSVITQLNEVVIQLQQANAERTLLKQRIAETENVFYNTKKDFWQLTSAARNNKKRRVRALVTQSVKGLEEFEPIEIKFNVQRHEVVIPLGHEVGEEKENSTCPTSQRVLVAKDEGLISDEAYHELRMALPEDERNVLPPISVLKQERNRQNEIIALHSVPEAKNGDGVRRDIKAVLIQLLSTHSIRNTVQANGNKLNLRFAADGRRTSNKIGTVMAVFNILNEQEHDCDHQYPIALYNGKEDYLEVKKCLGPVFAQVDDLQQNGIEVDGIHYTVTWYCCSDWKFLAMVYGLNSATGRFFCIWCYCTKAKISDFSIQDWPIERNLQQCTKNSAEKTTDGRKGSIHEPLISIPFTQVIVDTLHLFLRIMGLLFHQVIEFVINKKRMDILEKEQEKIGVPFKFFQVQCEDGSSQTQWTRLDGKDLRAILHKLDLKPIFEGTSHQRMTYKNVRKLWKGFSDLVGALDSEPGQENYKTPEEFKDHARKWARFFRVVHHDEDVTPYIHALVYHVPQFLEKCGGLSIFNCQPVEKKNHQQSRMFHQGTQKGGRKSSYTKQVMEKENRKIYARVNNLYRTKRAYQKRGHTEEDPGALHQYTHQNLEEG